MAVDAQRDYRLRWCDFDRYGRLHPFTLLDIFQDIATVQADSQHMGHDDMLAQGVFWAVIRVKYEMSAQPQLHQKVIARTWPHTPTRFSFLRDYVLSTEDGQQLVKATSEWVLMDAKTRGFASVTDYFDKEIPWCPERTFERKPKKLPDFDIENPLVTHVSLTPSYSDLDINGHVNNAKYANFIIDALNPSDQGNIAAFQMDYRYEVKADEPLDIYTLVEGLSVQTKGINPDGQVAFASRIDLAQD